MLEFNARKGTRACGLAKEDGFLASRLGRRSWGSQEKGTRFGIAPLTEGAAPSLG